MIIPLIKSMYKVTYTVTSFKLYGTCGERHIEPFNIQMFCNRNRKYFLKDIFGIVRQRNIVIPFISKKKICTLHWAVRCFTFINTRDLKKVCFPLSFMYLHSSILEFCILREWNKVHFPLSCTHSLKLQYIRKRSSDRFIIYLNFSLNLCTSRKMHFEALVHSILSIRNYTFHWVLYTFKLHMIISVYLKV